MRVQKTAFMERIFMNKKMMTLAAAGMLGLGNMAHAALDANLKIGTMNIMELMRDSEAGQKATKEMEAKRESLTAAIQKDEQVLSKAVEEYTSKQSMLSADAREKEETRLMTLKNNLETKIKNSEDELKRAMQYASDNLTQQAQLVIDEYGKANGYDLIQDTASGLIVYRKESLDVTKTLVANMDTSSKKQLADSKKITPKTTVASKQDADKKTGRA
jgi:outer membrane protein